MSNTSLKSKATKGMLWNSVEKFSVKAGQFILGIVMARILLPEDFGLIGMLSIFIAISQTFIDGGMGSGLVQKTNRTVVDFSTVFIFNFIVSTLFYLILYFSAPLIANFYNMSQLVLLTRVLSLNIVINSLSIVQRSHLTINIDFKTIAKVNVITVFAGGLLGITFAYLGYGVWALVIQNLSRALIATVLFWILSKWKFSLSFSKKSFNELFGFGSKLLMAGIYAKILNNIYNIVIGKSFAASELGFYTRAKNFTEMTSGTVTSIIQQVTYPILASIKDDTDRMISVYRRLIKMSAFFIFPSMTMLSLLADPIIRLLLTDKWLSAVILLQWMSFARIFYPISAINMNLLNAIGRSDLFLKVDLSKLPIVLIAMVITIPLGVKAMVIGQVITSGIAFFINAYLPGKYYDYGAIKQLKDMFPVFIATGLMAAMVFVAIFFIQILILKLLFGIVIGIGSFLFVSYLLKIEELNEFKKLLEKIRKKS